MISKRKLRAALLSKLNAEEDNRRHHRFFKIRIGGTIVATTKVSHGGRDDLGATLEALIARQLGLTTRQLRDLVRCPLDGPTYFSIADSFGDQA